MGNSLDGFAEVPVDEHGASLMLPRELLSDLMARADGAQVERVGFPINPLPVGNKSSLQGLGNQPSHTVLLDNVKGWPAIAGGAVSRRVRGLAKHLYVFSVHNKDGKEEEREQPEHRLAETLKNPNDLFTMGDMLWLLTWHLQQTGEAYWQKLQDGIGLATGLWPLPPANVTPVISEHGALDGYMVRDGRGGEYALDPSEVIRFWTPDPKTLFSAMGVLGPQAIEYDASRFLEDHLRSHFEQDATPRTAIIGKAETATVDPGAQRAFHRKWRSLYNSRVGTARNLPAFIPPGWDIKELSAHGSAAEVIPLKEANREQTLAAYGVPGTAVGMDKNVNRATAEAQAWVFDQNTISHYTDIIAEGLTVRLARDFDPKLRVGFREYVAPDKEHILKQEKQDLETGTRSVQQILRDRAANPADAPWGEFPIKPFNVGPYDGDFTIEDRIQAIGVGQISGAAASGTGDPRKRQPFSTLSMTRDDPMDVEAAQRRAIAHLQRFTDPLGRAVLGVLKSQHADILERLAGIDPALLGLSTALDAEPRERRVRHIFRVSEVISGELFNPEEWQAAFQAEVSDHLMQPFLAAANDATRTVAKEDFIFSVFAQEAVQTQTFRLAGQVDATTMRHVAQSVQAAIDGGEGAAGIQKRLETTFNRRRSRVIARTEILTAVQEGQVHGWRATEQVQGKRWNISGNNTRESHEAIHGQEVTLDGSFTLGSGAQANAPGDTRLSAADRVNCQCFMSPIVLGV